MLVVKPEPAGVSETSAGTVVEPALVEGPVSSFAVDGSNASSSASASSAAAAILAWPVWKRKGMLVNYKWEVSKYHVKWSGII